VSAAPSRLRLTVVSGDDAHHRYLVWLLAERGFEIDLWLVEPEAQRRRGAWRQRRRRDWLATIYHHWRRRLCGLDRYRRRAFALPGSLPRVPRFEVDSVNGPRAQALLGAAPSEATILIGCGILNQETLSLCASPALNIHGGHLPDYRGNHCIFFALSAGDYDNLGATIHYVDTGVDTGDILETIPVRAQPGDTAEAVYCRAEHRAFERLCARLEELSRGRPLPRRPQPRRGRTFKTRDRTPIDDIRYWWRRRIAIARASLREPAASGQPGPPQ
jgi:hypothetical protein